MTETGIYGGNDPAILRDYETWSGRNADNVLVPFDQSGWAAFDGSVQWSVDMWKGSTATPIYGIPMTVEGTSLEQTATGAYNGHYLAAAQSIAAANTGGGPIYIRIGWEFNGNWQPWAAAGHQDAFIQSFREVVDTFRSVSPAFKFVWDVNIDGGNIDPATAYPGDAYVDVIGADVYYNHQWDSADPVAAFQYKVSEPYGLQWQQDFAVQHGKPTAISEWGVSGDGDGPYVQAMFQWMADHGVIYENYWESNAAYAGELRNGQYPHAGDAFRAAIDALPSDAAPAPAHEPSAPSQNASSQDASSQDASSQNASSQDAHQAPVAPADAAHAAVPAGGDHVLKGVAPNAVADHAAATSLSVPLTGHLLANDTDASPLHVVSVQPLGGTAVPVPASGTVESAGQTGTLTVAADGSFGFRPTAPGHTVFVETVADSSGNHAATTLTFDVARGPIPASLAFGFALTEAHFDFSHGSDLMTAPDGTVTDLTGVGTIAFADGTVQERDGQPLTDDLFYVATNPDVWRTHMDPDQHYAQYGWHEGRDPSAYFSTRGYLAANPDVAAAGIDPLQHYHQYGWHEGRDPGAAFHTNAYLAANPDVAAAHIDPLQHYLEYGLAEGRHLL